MFLVAGLAVAGLAGIAAAFYLSIRSGNRGNRRFRSAGASRADAGRRPGSRSGGTPRPHRTDTSRAASGRTGPNPDLDFGDQVLVGGRRGSPAGPATSGGGHRTSPRTNAPTGEPTVARRLGDSPPPPEEAWPDDAGTDDSWPGDSHDAHAAGGAAKMAKPRRRVGFRKGADVDEELWPTETFGGVSDEQFWDDLASDKPLTTTARTAQQEPRVRNRPFDAKPAADPQAPPRARVTTGSATALLAMTGAVARAGGARAPAPIPARGPDRTRRPSAPRSSPPTRQRSLCRA